MKKNVFTLFALILLVGTSCQEIIDIEAEKKAIIAVLEEESDAVVNMDYTRLSETWLQDESAIYYYSGKANYSYRYGFEEIGTLLREEIENSPEPFFSKMEKTNYKIKVYNKCAWAVYDETNYNPEGEVLVKLLITKILEKIDGEWRIVYTSGVIKSSYEEEVEEEPEIEDTE